MKLVEIEDQCMKLAEIEDLCMKLVVIEDLCMKLEEIGQLDMKLLVNWQIYNQLVGVLLHFVVVYRLAKILVSFGFLLTYGLHR